MRAFVEDNRDRQNTAPVLTDYYGEEIYPGEYYYKSEDDVIFSQDTYRKLSRYCKAQGIKMDVEECRA